MTTGNGINHFNIELLNSNNFHTWKYRMSILLEEKDVFQCIKNEFDESSYTDEEAKKKAKREDNKCKSLIVQCLGDDQVDLVRESRTAHGMWKSLEEKYEKKGIPGQMIIRKQLMCLKLKEGEDLEVFLSKFDELVRQLKAAGAECKEEDLVCTMLLAMPKSFETVLTILENIPSDDLSLNIVKAKLRNEVERRKAQGQEVFWKKRPEFEKPAAFSTNSGICYYCGEKGHFKRQCPKYSHGMSSQENNRGMFHSHRGNRGGFPRQGYRERGSQTYRSNQTNRKGDHGGNWSYGNMVRNQGQPGRQMEIRSYHTRSGERSNEEHTDICFMTDSDGGMLRETVSKKLSFYIDSGCTDHLVNKKEYFSELLILKEPIKIAVAKNNNYMEATGVGLIKVISDINGKEKMCTIKNVFYVPNLRRNLLSVKRLEMSNIDVVFSKGTVSLYHNNYLIGLGHRNNLYEINFDIIKNESFQVQVENEILNLWHKRYGHICKGYFDKLVKNNMVDGIGEINLNKIEFCESCIKGKMSRLNFGTRRRANRVLEIIHTDVTGPLTPIAYNGARYFVTFIDDYTNFVCVYVIENKSQVFEYFREYCNMVQSKFNVKISVLRSDNGGEYISREFKNFCKENGIILDYTTPYTPQQNGKAERYNRSLIEKARSMIYDANVPKMFWNEAVQVAAYLINRSPSANLDLTPAELWYGEKPNVKNLRVFGCVAYAHVPDQLRTKIEKKSETCIMVGYSTTGYRLWSLEKQRIINARDVIFNEKEFYYKNRRNMEIENEKEIKEETLKQEESGQENLDQDNIEQEEIEEIDEDNNEEFDKNTEITRSGRRVNVPRKFGEYELYMAFDAMSFVEEVPESVNDLKGRADEDFWRRAMKKELESIEKNKTWDKVKIPEKAEILDTKWVFASKPYEEKIEDRYKARLVVRGCAQRKTFNYDEIYAPVTKMTTIRTLLSIGNQMNYYFHQMDVRNAFLNGHLKENIYIYPPVGVHCKEGDVLKLNKSLYGLKQAAKCWNEKINKVLLDMGFKRSENDYCLYMKEMKGEYMYLLLYVDDICLSGPNLENLKECKERLMKEFQMKDKGDLRFFLGLEIDYKKEEGILKIGQKKYVEGILRRFKFVNCHSVSTPIDPKLRINLIERNEENMEEKPVRELIGCLMYLMLGSRPDISFGVNYLSRYQDRNRKEVWVSLKRLLRYLKGTTNMQLVYKRNKIEKHILSCYVDADWATDINDRKSVSGYLIKIFGNVVSWITRKQHCVAMSSTEAELIALCSAVQDTLWYKKLLNDMNLNVVSFIVYEDNQGCISLIKNPENNRRIKHIDLKFNFVCENLKRGNMFIQYINSGLQLADLLTKGLHRPQFNQLCQEMGLELREGAF